MKHEKKFVAFYDNNCGLCSKAIDVFKNQKISANLDFTPLSDPIFHKLLKKKNIQFKKDHMYLLGEEGKLYMGSEAIFNILLHSKGFLRYIGIIGKSKLVIKLTQPFYLLFAKNRLIVSKLFRFVPDG